MEVITIDSEAYKDLVKKIDRIAEFVEKYMEADQKTKQEIWLDSFEVARLLKISTKTLQRLRKDKLVSYTILRGKCLYKLSEIERGLNERIIKADPRSLNDFRRNYLIENKKD
ncbi:MAG: helix-turn-helix domain-containing protein [Carboxylicivirga sp.]|nr:helix-turn-helix domain-containing protein [Carboxylicivirga sp.]